MKTKILLIMVVFLLFTTNGLAQEQFSKFGFELNGGVSFSTVEPANIDLKTGFGFEGSFHYSFVPHFELYGGWGWNKFNSDNSFLGNDACFEETGYVFGLQYKHPIGDSPISFFLRIGGLYNHIEIENSDGDILIDSGHGLGYQIALGIDIPVGSNWSLSPGFKYNALTRDIDYNGRTIEFDYNYLSFRVGVLKSF